MIDDHITKKSSQMVYERPIYRNEQEILDGLANDSISPDERVRFILSALYHTSIKFAGDVLIKEFIFADISLKIILKRFFVSFYEMYGVAYRIDKSISLLEKYINENRDDVNETLDEIDVLRWYKFVLRPRIGRTKQDILNGLNNNFLSSYDRLDLVISAIYFTDVEFSYDVLVKEFLEAKYKEKIFFTYIFDKFYAKNNSIYKINNSILLWQNYLKEAPEHSDEIIFQITAFQEHLIDYLEEHTENAPIQ